MLIRLCVLVFTSTLFLTSCSTTAMSIMSSSNSQERFSAYTDNNNIVFSVRPTSISTPLSGPLFELQDYLDDLKAELPADLAFKIEFKDNGQWLKIDYKSRYDFHPGSAVTLYCQAVDRMPGAREYGIDFVVRHAFIDGDLLPGIQFEAHWAQLSDWLKKAHETVGASDFRLTIN